MTRSGLLEPIRVSDVNLVSTDLTKRGPAVRKLVRLDANQDTSKHIMDKGPILVIRATGVLPAHTGIMIYTGPATATPVIQDLCRMQTRQTV